MRFPPDAVYIVLGMKRLFICIMLSVFFIAGPLSAQNISNSVKREMNMALLDMIEKYERLSVMSDAFMATEYISLFRDPHQMVYNDLVGYSVEEMLPLNKYVDALRKMSDVKVVFSDIVKSQPYIAAGCICVDVTFDKHISFRDQRSVTYSSDEFFGGPHKVTVVFAYDDFDGTCHIESVTGCVEPPLTGKDHLVYRNDKRMEKLMFRDLNVPAREGYYDVSECSSVEFDDNGQAFLPKSAVEEDWYYMQHLSEGWDPDVSVNVNASPDGFVRMSREKNPFRIKAYNSAAVAGAFVIDGNSDKKTSFSDEIGVEFRYMFDLGNRFNLGAYGALGLAYNYVGVEVKDIAYQYWGTSKAKYSYDIDHIGQRFHMADGVLSAGLAFEYALTNRWAFDIKAGLKAYYNLWTKKGDAYCEYDVRYDENEEYTHVKGFIRENTILNPSEFKPDVWPCPLSVEAGVGFSYNLDKSTSLFFGLEYEHGLNYYYQAALTEDMKLADYKDYSRPLTYSAKEGYDELQWSLTDTFHLKRRAVWVDFGVVFKF